MLLGYTNKLNLTFICKYILFFQFSVESIAILQFRNFCSCTTSTTTTRNAVNVNSERNTEEFDWKQIKLPYPFTRWHNIQGRMASEHVSVCVCPFIRKYKAIIRPPIQDNLIRQRDIKMLIVVGAVVGGKHRDSSKNRPSAMCHSLSVLI